MAAKGGVLWCDLIDDDVQGQHDEHQQETHEEKALWLGVTHTDLVHLGTHREGKRHLGLRSMHKNAKITENKQAIHHFQLKHSYPHIFLKIESNRIVKL